MILLQFLTILIIVLIGYVIIMAIGHGSSSSSGSTSPNYSSSQPRESHEEKYETEDGIGLHYDGFGDWHDDWGRHYHNTDGWGGKEMIRTDKDY